MDSVELNTFGCHDVFFMIFALRYAKATLKHSGTLVLDSKVLWYSTPKYAATHLLTTWVNRTQLSKTQIGSRRSDQSIGI